MSCMHCTNCGQLVDTDRKEMLVILDKYWYCEDCQDKDAIFEVIDELRANLDEKTRVCNGLTKSLADAIIELQTVYDSARQGLRRQGLNV